MSVLILCIDDNQQMLAVRKANLELLGYSVLTSSSAGAAIKLLKQVPVDVVLLEYKQEGLDAEAIAFHLKQQFPQLPIILLSAFAHMSERVLWLVDEYVMKSARSEELALTIDRIVLPKTKKSVCAVRALPSRAAASA